MSRIICLLALLLVCGCGSDLKGGMALTQGDCVVAQEEFEKSIQSAPDRMWPRRKLGQALICQKKYSQAEEALNKALEIKPGDPESYFYLGLALVGQDKTQDGLGLIIDKYTVPFKMRQSNYIKKKAGMYQKSGGSPEEIITGMEKALVKAEEIQKRADQEAKKN